MTKKPQPSATVTTAKDVERFRKAADAYTARVTKTKESARKALVKLGTHTKSGKLTKNYS